MKRIHMMIGIPGSGKTTFVGELASKNKYSVVSTDVVRVKNKGIEEKEVWPKVYAMIGEILENEDDVIFDATNVTKKVRDRFKENIGKYVKEYELYGYFFPTFYEVCIKRVDKRNRKPNELFIPLDVIESYGNVVYPPTYEENFKEAKVISNCKDLLDGLVDNAYQGYALYYKQGKDVCEEYSGFTNINTDEAIRVNTNFRLASVTKQFIAYGIMTLVEKNLLSLSDSLYDMFDDMPSYTKKISIEDLLSHTSGIFDYEDMDHTEKQVSDNDVLNFVRETNKQYFKTGARYQYSNTAYVLLGLIIEKVSKTNLGEYLKENVFKPFNMNNTVLDYEGITEIKPRAYGHLQENNKLVMKDQYWCSATCGDGGIYSSIEDLKKWLVNIQNLKSPYDLMEKTHFVKGNDIEYGLGLRIKHIAGHEIVYHCGDTIGTNTIIGFIKDLDIEFIFLTNCGGKDTSRFVENLKKRLEK